VPKVTFKDKNGAVQRTVEVESGASLRYAALENDVPLYCMWSGLSKFANCHGNGLCWTDRVRVSPSSAVNPRTVLEQAMNNIGTFKRNRSPQTRLACQVQVFEDCEVVTRCKGKSNRK
jgi:ferredoxin